jgi:hypothetical protein
MKKAVAIITALVALAGVSTASANVYGVPCRDSSGNVTLNIKPRNCVLGGDLSYQQAPIGNLRWRSWGGRSAYGKGTLRGNMGFRAPVRFKLYRLDRFEEDFYIYRRARGTTYPEGEAPIHWTMRLPLS